MENKLNSYNMLIKAASMSSPEFYDLHNTRAKEGHFIRRQILLFTFMLTRITNLIGVPVPRLAFYYVKNGNLVTYTNIIYPSEPRQSNELEIIDDTTGNKLSDEDLDKINEWAIADLTGIVINGITKKIAMQATEDKKMLLYDLSGDTTLRLFNGGNPDKDSITIEKLYDFDITNILNMNVLPGTIYSADTYEGEYRESVSSVINTLNKSRIYITPSVETLPMFLSVAEYGGLTIDSGADFTTELAELTYHCWVPNQNKIDLSLIRDLEEDADVQDYSWLCDGYPIIPEMFVQPRYAESLPNGKQVTRGDLCDIEVSDLAKCISKGVKDIVTGNRSLTTEDSDEIYSKDIETINVPQLKINPYNYQKYGIQFMIDRLNKYGFVLNADDVGLGKTLQSIACIVNFMQNGLNRILIVCKKSIRTQWVSEINKFTDLKEGAVILPMTDNQQSNSEIVSAVSMYKEAPVILVTNYHYFIRHAEELKECEFKACIIDEVHLLRNKDGVMNNNISSVVNGLPTIYLTGTPIMTKPEDIFGILSIASKSYFGDYDSFKSRFLQTATGRFGEYVTGYKDTYDLKKLIQAILIRRTENEVAIELPNTMYNVVECSTDEYQNGILLRLAQYKSNLQRKITKLNSKTPKTQEEEAELLKLETFMKSTISAEQFVASDIRMYYESKSDFMRNVLGDSLPEKYEGSSKTEKTCDIIEDIVNANHKVIVFSKFSTSVKLLLDDLNSKYKIKALSYTGEDNDTVRQNNIRLFTTTDEYNVLIGTDAMAEGLNLQCAKYVINYDQPDSSAIKIQRIGRARRAGSQQGAVIVYDMISVLDQELCDEDGYGTIVSETKDGERLRNIDVTKDTSDSVIGMSDVQRSVLMNRMYSEPFTIPEKKDVVTHIEVKSNETPRETESNETSKRALHVASNQDTDTRNGNVIYTYRILDKLTKDEYIALSEKLKKYNIYYSKFKHCFISYTNQDEVMNSLTI